MGSLGTLAGVAATPGPCELAAPALLLPLLPEGTGGLVPCSASSLENRGGPSPGLVRGERRPLTLGLEQQRKKGRAGKGPRKTLAEALKHALGIPCGCAGSVAAGFDSIREAILGIYLNTWVPAMLHKRTTKISFVFTSYPNGFFSFFFFRLWRFSSYAHPI